MPKIDRAGTFIAYPLSVYVKGFDGKLSTAAAFHFGLAQEVIGDQRVDIADQELEVYGDYFVIGADGQPNENAVKQLADSLGWDGSLVSIEVTDWTASPVQIDVEADEWKGRVRYKATWMRPWDADPGGGHGKLDADAVRVIDQRVGSQMRAMLGEQNVGAPAPTVPPPSQQILAAVKDAIREQYSGLPQAMRVNALRQHEFADWAEVGKSGNVEILKALLKTMQDSGIAAPKLPEKPEVDDGIPF